MIGISQGPDKGLLDVIFGGNKVEEQANAGAKDVASEAAALPFDKVLAQSQQQSGVLQQAQSQDQTNKSASAIVGQGVNPQQAVDEKNSKGGIEEANVEKIASKVEKTDKTKKIDKSLTAKKAETAEAVAAQKSKQAKVKEKQVLSDPLANLNAQSLQATQTSQALMEKNQLAIQNQEKQNALLKSAQLPIRSNELFSNQNSVLQANPGAMNLNAQLALAQNQMQMNPMASGQVVALPMMSQAPVMLQPVVMPVALPSEVTVLNVESDDVNGYSPTFAGKPLKEWITSGAHDVSVNNNRALGLSSQEFMERRSLGDRAILNADSKNGLNPLDRESLLTKTKGLNKDKMTADDRIALATPQLSASYLNNSQASDVKNQLPNVSLRTAGDERRLELANSAALSSQVSSLMARGGGQIRIKVSPENLGEIDINVSRRGDQLDVKFETSTLEAKQLLSSQLDELRSKLTTKQFKIGSLEVDHSLGSESKVVVTSPDSLGVGQMQNLASSRTVDLGGGGFANQNSSWSQESWSQSQGRPDNAWERYEQQQESQSKQWQGKGQNARQRYQDAYLSA